MNVVTLKQQQLDDFVSAQPQSQFLQSWNWGEFQKTTGHQVWRFGVMANNQLIAAAQIIEHKLPLKKSYLYCPGGPIIKQQLPAQQEEQALKLILSKARDLTGQTSQTEEIFFRLEPTFEIRNFHPPQEPCSGGRAKFEIRKTKPVQPATTLILDLTKPTDELLTNAHAKTRYNIKLAKKRGIIIEQLANDKFDQVWPLLKQTAKRDNFNLHHQDYYQKMLSAISTIKLWVAKYQNEIIACALVSYFGNTVTYLHGASAYQHRSLMAPHLLQWRMITDTQSQNYQFYDFHGIAPTDDCQHPWSGLTRFKKGFGGKAINYPGTFDFIYQANWYRIYKIFRTINYLIRKT